MKNSTSKKRKEYHSKKHTIKTKAPSGAIKPRKMERTIYFLLMIYIVVSQIMSLVFFIDICKEWDNLFAIIFAGPIVAELKGLLWIFFI